MGNVEPTISKCNVCDSPSAINAETRELTRGGFCEKHGFKWSSGDGTSYQWENRAHRWFTEPSGRGTFYQACIVCKQYVGFGALCQICKKQNDNWIPD